MSDSRTFPTQNLNLTELTDSLTQWLTNENFDCQILKGEDGATIAQVAKRGTWRNFVGMSTALNIVFHQNETNLVVEIGAGKWIDKAAVGTVSMFILWPLLFTAAFGAWQQMKMPERVYENILGFINKLQVMVIHLDPEIQKVPAATEKVQVPSGVGIKIKRARTIERTISIHWESSSERSVNHTFNIGDTEVINRSVRSGIEEKLGHTYKETDHIEYEVELDGKQSNQYTLTWVDTMRNGTVEYIHNGRSGILPFNFREQTELQVSPT